MSPRRIRMSSLLLVLGLCGGLGLGLIRTPAAGQESPQAAGAPSTAPGVIKAEANLVLVDVVATDKKGNYIRDLEANDFRVLEDDKEQAVSSFSRVSDAAQSGAVGPRYLVLFFDNSTMLPDEQMRAREAAGQFVAKTASRDRMMAVVDFGGAFRIAQNFTDNPELLKRAVSGVKFASLQPSELGQTTEIASMGRPSMVQVRSDFAARSVLLAIRNLCKTLRPVPGRKSLILFSAGFPLNAERLSELTATIDAANKANVAIYTLDVRGLTGLRQSITPGMTEPGDRPPGFPPGAALAPAESPFAHEELLLASLLGGLKLRAPLAQRPPGGGGGEPPGGGGSPGGGGRPGGGQPSGGGGGNPPGGGGGPSPGGGVSPGGPSPGPGSGTGPGGTRGGTPPRGGPSTDAYGRGRPGYETYPPRSIIPPLMDNVTSNQQVLYALAAGTGGFTIFNTNDFTEGLGKIAQELDEYYILGYVPPSVVHDGSYHKIEVKVERKGVKLRFRNGYYDTKSPDLLAGKPEGKALEEIAARPEPGIIPVSLSVPYFYADANVARVNLALEIPANTLEFQKEKGKSHFEVAILGIAYRPDGSVAARFSDRVRREMEKKEVKEFEKGTFSYRNTFNVTPGSYTLKVVLSGGGQKFGKYEAPLTVAPYDGKQFHLSAVALSNRMQPVSALTAGLDTALLEERMPLVVQGVELIPAARYRFRRDEKVGLYVEVYEPLMTAANPPRVGIMFNIIDRKTNQQIISSNTIPVNSFAQASNPVIPVGVMIPVEKLAAGEYRLQVHARDAAGNVSPHHTVEFAVD